MDKNLINKYLVQMRSSVTQARVHTLNKLIREIRKLKNKKGTDEQKQRNIRKAERFKNEVFCIKKFERDEISRFALLCQENPSDMLKKNSLSLEDRAKIRLIAHKSITVQVEIFRLKYPDWKLKLPPLLVQLGLKRKHNKNKSVDGLPKTSIKEFVKSSEKENAEESPEKTVTSVNESSAKITCSTKKDNHKSKINANSLENVPDKIKKVNVAEVRRFAELVELEPNSNTSQEDVSDSEVSNQPNTITDPFFFTVNSCGSDASMHSNSETEIDIMGSTNTVEVKGDYFIENSQHQGQIHKRNSMRYPNVKGNTRKEKRERGEVEQKKSINSNYSYSKRFETSKKIKCREGPTSSNASVPGKLELLHPSWEAKRKLQKQQILPFQGKKLIFNN